MLTATSWTLWCLVFGYRARAPWAFRGRRSQGRPFDSRGTAKRQIAGGRRRRHRCVRWWNYRGPLHFREAHGAECGRAVFSGRRNRSRRRRQDRAGCVPGPCAAGAGKALSITQLAAACATVYPRPCIGIPWRAGGHSRVVGHPEVIQIGAGGSVPTSRRSGSNPDGHQADQ